MTNDAAPRPGDWRRHDVDPVRAAAAVLIANSHLEAFYPHAWMAGDGLVGNALFFFLSGFGVALSASARTGGFVRWLGRRAARLYPAVVTAGVVVQLGLLGDWRRFAPLDWATTFVYPTTYGYVGHVMIVYAGLYWLLRPRSRWPLAAVVVSSGLAAVGVYATVARDMPAGAPLALGQTPKALHWFYFTAVALGGALFAPAVARPRGTLARDAAALSVVFAVYVGLKFEMVQGRGARAFGVLHVLTAVVCVLAVRVSAADAVQGWLRRARPIGGCVSLLAGLTLEMYVVQTWTHGWPALVGLRYPLNLAAFWVVTVAGAVVLRAIAGTVVRTASRPG